MLALPSLDSISTCNELVSISRIGALVKIKSYCPLKSEKVSLDDWETEVFGAGALAAKKLANKLSFLSPSEQVIIYGCSGALDPQVKVGDSFLIREIVQPSGRRIPLSIPRSLSHLPQASLLTQERPLIRQEEKQKAFENYEAQLVDCEMGFILEHLLERQYSQLIFVRTAIDSHKDEIRFLNDQGKFSLRSCSSIVDLVKMSFHFMIYRRKMRDFLQRLSNVLLQAR